MPDGPLILNRERHEPHEMERLAGTVAAPLAIATPHPRSARGATMKWREAVCKIWQRFYRNWLLAVLGLIGAGLWGENYFEHVRWCAPLLLFGLLFWPASKKLTHN